MKSVTGKRISGGSPGKVRGMHLEAAQNGVISHLSIPMQKPMSMQPDEPPTPVLHTDMKSLQDHVAKHMGHLFGTADAKTKGGGRVVDKDKDGK